MISAEGIKALVRPNNHFVIIDGQEVFATTMEIEAIHTLQTLLNQAAEALHSIMLVSRKQDSIEYADYNKACGEAHEALAAIEPYIAKEGE